uniref:Uncharacterized protein n=1 Tax=Arundo donax TaxID=35708 RepID=A0A0A9FFX6_ARUDO
MSHHKIIIWHMDTKISIWKEKPYSKLIIQVYHFSKKFTQITINQVILRLRSLGQVGSTKICCFLDVCEDCQEATFTDQNSRTMQASNKPVCGLHQQQQMLGYHNILQFLLSCSFLVDSCMSKQS